jgi:hypothetical protein
MNASYFDAVEQSRLLLMYQIKYGHLLITDELEKKLKFTLGLMHVAFKKNNYKLFNKLKQKRNKLIAELMKKLDDNKHSMNNEDYLNMCKIMQLIYNKI